MSDTELKWIKCKDCDGIGEVIEGDHLDLDSIESLRAELISSVTPKPEYDIHSGLVANRIGERIRSASRVAWLANRMAWLEACEVIKAESRGEHDAAMAARQEALDWFSREMQCLADRKVPTGHTVVEQVAEILGTDPAANPTLRLVPTKKIVAAAQHIVEWWRLCAGCGQARAEQDDAEHGSVWICLNSECEYDK